MPFCHKCGKDAGSNSFCGGCGTKIVKDSAGARVLSTPQARCTCSFDPDYEWTHASHCATMKKTTQKTHDDWDYP